MAAPNPFTVLSGEQFERLSQVEPHRFFEWDLHEELESILNCLEQGRRRCSRREAALWRKFRDVKFGLLIPSSRTCYKRVDIRGHLMVDGCQKGDAILGGGMVVGESGRVFGRVTARSVVCRGVIQGDMLVSGTIHLAANGRIEGRVEASSLQIEDGARFLGHCRLAPETQPSPAGILPEWLKRLVG